MLALTILNDLDVGQLFDTLLTAWLEVVFESSLPESTSKNKRSLLHRFLNTRGSSFYRAS